jgi:hypothetical protein
MSRRRNRSSTYQNEYNSEDDECFYADVNRNYSGEYPRRYPSSTSGYPMNNSRFPRGPSSYNGGYDDLLVGPPSVVPHGGPGGYVQPYTVLGNKSEPFRERRLYSTTIAITLLLITTPVY